VNAQGDRIYMRVPAGPDLLPPGFERAKIAPTGNRRHPEVADARDQEWETMISLPPGVRVERLPDDVMLDTSVGHYTAHYTRSGNDIAVARSLVVDRDVVQPTSYPDLERLLYAALVDARAILVLDRAE
jgi:uncharacterized protein DUF3858